MVEIENKEEPDFFQMAADKLGLSKEDRELIQDYGLHMFHALFAFYLITDNKDKEFTIEELREYADKKSPEGSILVDKVLQKAKELKNLSSPE